MKRPNICRTSPDRALRIKTALHAGRGADNPWPRCAAGIVALTTLSALLAVLPAASPARAATFNWKANTTGDWSVTGNWVEGLTPTNGDDAVITNTGASAILSSASSNLSSLTLGGTLTFTNWDTILTATNITILSGGVITLPVAFSNNWMSNNIYISCTNLTIASNGAINADGRGYLSNNGPGGGGAAGSRTGGSHGGRGGGWTTNPSTNTYGSVEAPLAPGSGASDSGGNGGGAIRIIAAGVVTNNGTISANGSASAVVNYGGGSGGSIYIACRTFAGSNGIARANGGNGLGGTAGGGGGGGRISVRYDSAAQSNEPAPSVTFSASPGNPGGSDGRPGNIGTLYFTDNRFLTENVTHSGQWMVPGFTNFTATALTISNVSIGFPENGFLLNVAGNLTITGAGGKLYLGSNSYSSTRYSTYLSDATSGPTLRIGGNLILTNGAQLYIFSGYSNAATSYGALVDVSSDVFIASNSSIFPYSQQNYPNTNLIASPLFRMRDLTVAPGGSINADDKGYRGKNGPGGSSVPGRGAGYGGGGGGTGAGGATYGYSNAPTMPGSGGGNAGGEWPSNGGGLVRIEARTVRVDGTITANGSGYNNYGSGGGIFILCNRLEGNGTISANAPNSVGGGRGGSGGGRIAVWFDVRNVQAITERLQDDPTYTERQATNLPSFMGAFSANGGTGANGNGTNGTIMFIQVPSMGTLFTIY